VTGCSAAAAQYTPAGMAQHACAAGSGLPMTGLSLGIMVAAAAALILLGLVLRASAPR
jgi:hypothetical protein